MDKDLVRGLSEKEVEIEHLKSTVIALNQKVMVQIKSMYQTYLGDRRLETRIINEQGYAEGK